MTSKDVFNAGTYAARIRLSDGPDRLVEAFWLQTDNSYCHMEEYAELDFEYYTEFPDTGQPQVDVVAWDRLATQPGECNDPANWQRERYDHGGSQSGRWLGVLFEVVPDQEVTFALFDADTGALLLGPDVFDGPWADLTPEPESPLRIHFQSWLPEWLATSCPWQFSQDYEFLVDWVTCVDRNTSYDWAGIQAIVADLRANGIARADGIANVFVGSFESGDLSWWSVVVP
jgi:hypothetical protein